MFLLFEVYNVVMVVGSPVIWPTYLIFIIISLTDITSYWESRNKAVRIFSHIPDVYWYMFAKFFLVDYAIDIYEMVTDDVDTNRAASNATDNMWLIISWFLLYPVNMLLSILYAVWAAFLAWPFISTLELFYTLLPGNQVNDGPRSGGGGN